MIELPEAQVLADQLDQTVRGKRVERVTMAASPHKFAWYSGDPGRYSEYLYKKAVEGANGGCGYTCGGNTELKIGDMLLVTNIPLRYHAPGEARPKKHQMLLEFEDDSAVSGTVQMWGGMFCFPAREESLHSSAFLSQFRAGGAVNGVPPSPLTDAFTRGYFDSLAEGCGELSAKAFLATEQRIPGLGNGVLQDILFVAGVHPRTKLRFLSPGEWERLYHAVRDVLTDMTLRGGRDTERDLFGCPGGYRTLLSKNTLGEPCPVCGGEPRREAYLGGNIYYCPACQPDRNSPKQGGTR